MTRDDISAMALSDDSRTFWIPADLILPQADDIAELCLNAPHAYDILEIWHHSDGAGADIRILIDSQDVVFDDTAENGVPVNTGAKVKSDVVGTIFTVGVAGVLQIKVEVADTGCTKISVTLICRRLIAEAFVT